MFLKKTLFAAISLIVFSYEATSKDVTQAELVNTLEACSKISVNEIKKTTKVHSFQFEVERLKNFGHCGCKNSDVSISVIAKNKQNQSSKSTPQTVDFKNYSFYPKEQKLNAIFSFKKLSKEQEKSMKLVFGCGMEN